MRRTAFAYEWVCTPLEHAPVNAKNIRPVNAATFTECMEQLQEGYLLSVAATAGCLVERLRRDRFGADVSFMRPNGPQREEVSLLAQLKCTTTRVPDPAATSFGYQFHNRSHFDRLVMERTTIKAILLVMVTDPDQSRWSDGDHESLRVRKCCYWVNLEGQTSEARKPTVQVPTRQIFTAEALNGLLDRQEEGSHL